MFDPDYMNPLTQAWEAVDFDDGPPEPDPPEVDPWTGRLVDR